MKGQTVQRAFRAGYKGGKIVGRIGVGLSMIGLGGLASAIAGTAVGGVEIMKEMVPDEWVANLSASFGDGEEQDALPAGEVEIQPGPQPVPTHELVPRAMETVRQDEAAAAHPSRLWTPGA